MFFVLQHSFFVLFFCGTGVELGPCDCQANSQKGSPLCCTPKPDFSTFQLQFRNVGTATISSWELFSYPVLRGSLLVQGHHLSQHAEVHPGSCYSGFLQPRKMLTVPKGRTSVISGSVGFPSQWLCVTSGNFSLPAQGGGRCFVVRDGGLR